MALTAPFSPRTRSFPRLLATLWAQTGPTHDSRDTLVGLRPISRWGIAEMRDVLGTLGDECDLDYY